MKLKELSEKISKLREMYGDDVDVKIVSNNYDTYLQKISDLEFYGQLNMNSFENDKKGKSK